MFTGVKAGKPNQTTVLSQAFTEMASSIASALTDHSSNHTSTPGTPPSSSRHSCASSSPGRLVERRSKYIQQLKELHLLVEAGALTKRAFTSEAKKDESIHGSHGLIN